MREGGRWSWSFITAMMQAAMTQLEQNEANFPRYIHILRPEQVEAPDAAEVDSISLLTAAQLLLICLPQISDVVSELSSLSKRQEAIESAVLSILAIVKKA